MLLTSKKFSYIYFDDIAKLLDFEFRSSMHISET